ncbi:MAG: lactate utilization protein [Acidobacteria bacterium]|nr:lactate utilization protein [Acidobacteriota bacterium]
MTNRARMIETVRAAVRQGHLPDAEARHPGRFDPPPFDGDLEQRFRTEFAALGGVVHDAAGRDDVTAVVLQVLAGEPTRTVLAWDARWLPVPGVLEALAAQGVGVLHQRPDHARSQPHRVELAAASVGLTGADAGLAETGSIVVASGPGRGRLASLLPRVHIAILRRRDIVASLPAVMTSRPDLVTSGANFVCITGPSRTADIEHVLARGVHGPGDIHVILAEG